jgi:hypothetical protein
MPGKYFARVAYVASPEYGWGWYSQTGNPHVADTIHVEAGEQKILDFRLPWAGKISGNVTLPPEVELGSFIYAVPVSDFPLVIRGYARVDENNHFEIPQLPPGPYHLSIHRYHYADGRLVRHDPETIQVHSRRTTEGIDFAFGELQLFAWGEVDEFLRWTEFRVISEVASDTSTTSNVLENEPARLLVPPDRYLIEAIPSQSAHGRYQREWYRNARRVEDAEWIVLGPGDVKRVELELDLGGVIAGRVLGPSGQPVDALEFRVEAHDEMGTVVAMTNADGLGEFLLGGLSSGAYRVRVRPGSQGEAYLPTWFPSATDSSMAEPIEVEAPDRVENVNVLLQLR